MRSRMIIGLSACLLAACSDMPAPEFPAALFPWQEPTQPSNDTGAIGSGRESAATSRRIASGIATSAGRAFRLEGIPLRDENPSFHRPGTQRNLVVDRATRGRIPP